MFKKKIKSKRIQDFVDRMWLFQQEHPEEIFPPPTDAVEAFNCLTDVFLGPNWYTACSVSAPQVNTIILSEILKKHSKEYRTLVKEKQRNMKK